MIKLYTFREFKWHTLIIKTVEKKYMDKNYISKSEIVLEDNYVEIIKTYLRNLGFNDYTYEYENELNNIDLFLSNVFTHNWYKNKYFTFYYFICTNYCMSCFDLHGMPEERYLKIAYYKYLDKFAWEKKEKRKNDKDIIYNYICVE